MVIKIKSKSKIKSQEPNPAFEGTRGYALVCFLVVRPPAPLNSGVGPKRRKSKSPLCRQGRRGLWAVVLVWAITMNHGPSFRHGCRNPASMEGKIHATASLVVNHAVPYSAAWQVLAFWHHAGRGLVVFVGVRQPIRLRHAVFRLLL